VSGDSRENLHRLSFLEKEDAVDCSEDPTDWENVDGFGTLDLLQVVACAK
jgi:hypothetical protein